MIERNCIVCDKKFKTVPSKVKLGHGKFCSYDCRGEYYSGKNHMRWGGGKLRRKCLICDEIFYVKKNIVEKGRGLTCSPKCSGKYHKGERCHNWKGGKIRKKCLNCGKYFMIDRDKAEKGWGKFCTHACYGVYHSGENNSNWLGGKSFEPYNIEFNNELKEYIRVLNSHRCQQCFRHQDELFTKNGEKYKLRIHHIDYDKKNNNIENLISLCMGCHNQTNFNRNDWSNYFVSRFNMASIL